MAGPSGLPQALIGSGPVKGGFQPIDQPEVKSRTHPDRASAGLMIRSDRVDQKPITKVTPLYIY